MFALIELLIFIVLLPYILFGVVLAMIFEAICAVFEPKLLMGAVWLMIVGIWLMGHMPTNDLSWQTMIEVVAQSRVFGVPTPFIPMCAAVCVLVAAFFARKRNAQY